MVRVDRTTGSADAGGNRVATKSASILSGAIAVADCRGEVLREALTGHGLTNVPNVTP